MEVVVRVCTVPAPEDRVDYPAGVMDRGPTDVAVIHLRQVAVVVVDLIGDLGNVGKVPRH
ncbi:hypothetical protein ACFL1X_12100 [Candidatus Hydrogenedentota bacterium]